jgi:hypothetical protein
MMTVVALCNLFVALRHLDTRFSRKTFNQRLCACNVGLRKLVRIFSSYIVTIWWMVVCFEWYFGTSLVLY